MECYNLEEWAKTNEENFRPPVCAKLMFGRPTGELKIMFVGGPNSRVDYHLEVGEELFYMHKGNMVLQIIEKQKLKKVEIKQGQMFLLPARVPHSPQRPEAHSLGLVIERDRSADEIDCLRYYVQGQEPALLWENWFHCDQLESLGEIVAQFKTTEEAKTGKPTPGFDSKPHFEADSLVTVEDPFSFEEWVRSHATELATTTDGVPLVKLGQTRALVYGDLPFRTSINQHETFVWQFKGSSSLTHGPNGESKTLSEGMMALIQPQYQCEVQKGSVILTVQQFK